MVQRVASGDREAFRTLVETHQRPLSAYARRMMNDVDSADDIVQEAFLRLWTRARSYNPQAARLTTWLHNIAHNLCIDSFRKNSRMTSVALDAVDALSVEGPEYERQSAERSAAVRSALAGLPERQRSALLMCHYQGLSNREAAHILDVSVDALESLLARARRRLKQELEPNDGK